MSTFLQRNRSAGPVGKQRGVREFAHWEGKMYQLKQVVFPFNVSAHMPVPPANLATGDRDIYRAMLLFSLRMVGVQDDVELAAFISLRGAAQAGLDLWLPVFTQMMAAGNNKTATACCLVTRTHIFLAFIDHRAKTMELYDTNQGDLSRKECERDAIRFETETGYMILPQSSLVQQHSGMGYCSQFVSYCLIWRGFLLRHSLDNNVFCNPQLFFREVDDTAISIFKIMKDVGGVKRYAANLHAGFSFIFSAYAVALATHEGWDRGKHLKANCETRSNLELLQLLKDGKWDEAQEYALEVFKNESYYKLDTINGNLDALDNAADPKALKKETKTLQKNLIRVLESRLAVPGEHDYGLNPMYGLRSIENPEELVQTLPAGGRPLSLSLFWKPRMAKVLRASISRRRNLATPTEIDRAVQCEWALDDDEYDSDEYDSDED